MKIGELVDQIKGGKLSHKDTLPEPKEFTTSKSLEKTVDLDGHDMDVNLGGSFNGSISLINRDNKEERKNDPEGVLLKPSYPTKELNQLINPEPLFELEQDTAYLRYMLGLKANFGVSGNVSGIGVGVDSQANWSTSYYSKHELSNDDITLAEAILEDVGVQLDSDSGANKELSALASIATLFDDEPLSIMNEGDILTFAAGGKIGATLTLDAGDLLAGSVTYSGLFDEAIPIKYKAGLKLEASVTFTGDHILAIGSIGNGEYEVIVRRSSAALSEYSAQLGASAVIDLQQTIDIINGYLGQITEIPTERIEALREEIKALIAQGAGQLNAFVEDLGVGEIQAISDLYDQLVEDLQGQLGEWLEDGVDMALKPLDALESLLKDWSGKLQKYASLKLSLNFGYRYSRLDASSDLLRFTCGEQAFNDLRGGLMTFKLDADALKANPGINIRRFLNADIDEVTRVVGGQLTVGDWKFGSSVGSKEQWITVRDHLQKDKVVAVSYLGSRWYEAKDFKDTAKYSFIAQAASGSGKESGNSDGTNATTTNIPPRLTDLDYTLGVKTKFKEMMSLQDLQEFIDFAAVFGAADNLEADSDFAKLTALGLKTGVETEIELGVTVTQSAARKVIRTLAEPSHELYASALARSMFMWREGSHFVKGRRTIAERIELYYPVWKKLLDQGNSNSAQAYLKEQMGDKFKDLKIWEGRQFDKLTSNQSGSLSKKPKIQSMAAIINKREKYLTNLKDYRVAMDLLNDALMGTGPNYQYHKFEEIFDGFSEAWEFSYSCRLFAALIDLAVKANPNINLNEVEYTFKLTQDGETHQLSRA